MDTLEKVMEKYDQHMRAGLEAGRKAQKANDEGDEHERQRQIFMAKKETGSVTKTLKDYIKSIT